MKSAAIKLKMYVGEANVINNNNDMPHVIARSFLISFVALAVLYVFLIGNMVSNIVARRNLEAEARTLSGEVRNLELEYLSMSNAIDLNFSRSLGFQETKPAFATRKSLGLLSVPGSAGGLNNSQNEI